MDPAEYGMTEEDLGLTPDDPAAPVTTDMSQLLALAGQGAVLAANARQGRPTPPPTAAAAARAREVAQNRQRLIQERLAAISPIAEIEQRLSLAGYYRALLDQPLFEDEDQYTHHVEQEVRAFILSRLGELLGTAKPKEPEFKFPFSDAEVKALRVFAGALLTKQPSILQAPVPQVPATPAEPEPQAPAPRVAPAAPRVRGARRPRQEAPQTAPAPAPAAAPRARRAAAPRTAVPAPQPETEPEVEEVAHARPRFDPAAPDNSPKPIPMPQGVAMTAVTANDAASTMAGMDREIRRQLK